MNQVRVGVGVLIWKDEKILMMRRLGSHGQGTWSAPGGHLEFGEDPFECARRETREEVDIKIDNLRFKGITNDIFEEGKHYITIWVEADYAKGEAKINSKDELTELDWFSFENLPSPLFQSMKNYLAGNLIETK